MTRPKGSKGEALPQTPPKARLWNPVLKEWDQRVLGPFAGLGGAAQRVRWPAWAIGLGGGGRAQPCFLRQVTTCDRWYNQRAPGRPACGKPGWASSRPAKDPKLLEAQATVLGPERSDRKAGASIPMTEAGSAAKRSFLRLELEGEPVRGRPAPGAPIRSPGLLADGSAPSRWHQAHPANAARTKPMCCGTEAVACATGVKGRRISRARSWSWPPPVP